MIIKETKKKIDTEIHTEVGKRKSASAFGINQKENMIDAISPIPEIILAMKRRLCFFKK